MGETIMHQQSKPSPFVLIGILGALAVVASACTATPMRRR